MSTPLWTLFFSSVAGPAISESCYILGQYSWMLRSLCYFVISCVLTQLSLCRICRLRPRYGSKATSPPSFSRLLPTWLGNGKVRFRLCSFLWCWHLTLFIYGVAKEIVHLKCSFFSVLDLYLFTGLRIIYGSMQNYR